ncbi:MAG: flagellar biosynthesis protein FlgE [Tolumonas sp.]|uniref:flagellar biosynthesis protein FlgE n=1 Tax=uncultured Tolumonas sp. TaxID=263765 RepID=UPI002A0A2C27|nr:flagellar biosynthesis protein FlgE [uncultured Tolumonas sp.]MDD2341882.1 flagellar biosynthesis protein FlgE [Tolumonas sp.]MDD2840848.1 flagellar biosynthesis protein FlgE [Tolumonas sp.]
MNINSAFSSGVLGLQKATSQLDASASKIAQQTLPSSDQGTSVSQQDAIPDSLVQLKMAEIQGKASAEVITRSDQMIGSLLDIHV